MPDPTPLDRGGPPAGSSVAPHAASPAASPDDDARHMRRAIELAARGLGSTSPNPPVGAVVVARGRTVGESWHRVAGGPHAEVLALERAGAAARGATAYVTLEPCDHVGRTAPCSRALIDAGIRRVVYAVADPNPVAAGGGATLRAADIDVTVGVLERDARTVARGFLHHVATGRPWVVAKYAMSLDGRIATRTGDSRWITGPEARAAGHRLRHELDAILVGVGTVVADDPALTARPAPEALGGEAPRHPRPVVIDPRGRTPLDCRLLDGSAPVRPVIVVGESCPDEVRDRLAARGATVVPLPRGADGRIAPADVLRALALLGTRTVLVEGGADTHGAFADADLVDEVVAFVAPTVIGGSDAPGAVGGLGAGSLREAVALDDVGVGAAGADVVVRGHVRRAAGTVLDPRAAATPELMSGARHDPPDPRRVSAETPPRRTSRPSAASVAERPDRAARSTAPVRTTEAA